MQVAGARLFRVGKISKNLFQQMETRLYKRCISTRLVGVEGIL